jgi:hypothetical protein
MQTETNMCVEFPFSFLCINEVVCKARGKGKSVENGITLSFTKTIRMKLR